MLKKDKLGMKFEDYEEHKTYLEKVEKLEFDINYLFFTRHNHFIPDGCPACDICGATKLVHGVGRYISFDADRKDDLAIFLCGHCLNYLEDKWKIKTDMS